MYSMLISELYAMLHKNDMAETMINFCAIRGIPTEPHGCCCTHIKQFYYNHDNMLCFVQLFGPTLKYMEKRIETLLL